MFQTGVPTLICDSLAISGTVVRHGWAEPGKVTEWMHGS